MPIGKRFWRLRYSEGGARRKLTLGQYPAVSLGEARAKRDELREAKARGIAPHAVPLSRQAATLLTELQPLTGRWRYVFPSARMDGRPMSENAVRVALRSMGFSNEEMTAHGFRSLGSTALNTLGYRADVIEAALAHIQGGVRGVYNRSVYWEERRAMMQEWADWLDGLMASEDRSPWPSAEIRK